MKIIEGKNKNQNRDYTAIPFSRKASELAMGVSAVGLSALALDQVSLNAIIRSDG